MTTVASPHIRHDEHGTIWIDDTNVKVIEVVLDRLAYGWRALAHYYDHQADMDEEIARQAEHVQLLRQQAADSPLLTRLKARGLLR